MAPRKNATKVEYDQKDRYCVWRKQGQIQVANMPNCYRLDERFPVVEMVYLELGRIHFLWNWLLENFLVNFLRSVMLSQGEEMTSQTPSGISYLIAR